jgi:hypothetical protein
MRIGFKLVFFVAALTASTSGIAGQERSFGVIDRLAGEDPSCDLVNRAYEKTANASNYTIYINELRSNGTIRPVLEDWLTPKNEILDYSVPGKGGIKRRSLRLTVLAGVPLLRNCRFVAKIDSVYGGVMHYAAAWQRGEWKAQLDIWISSDTDRFLQVTRDFSSFQSPFPFAKTLEIYRYPGQDSIDPKIQAAVIPF